MSKTNNHQHLQPRPGGMLTTRSGLSMFSPSSQHSYLNRSNSLCDLNPHKKPPAARRGSPAFTLFSLVQQFVIRISSLFRPSRHGLAVTDHSGSRRDVSQTRRIVIRHFKPKYTALYYCCVIITLLFPTLIYASGSYSGGDGQPATPFQIAEPNDLIEMSQHAEDWNKNFILTADINMYLAEPNTFTTALVAPDTSTSSGFQGTPFTGSFDGQNHSIYNLTIDTVGLDNDYLGLFGLVVDGQISNLGLENTSITGGSESHYLGGLVGSNGDFYTPGSTISHCFANGSLVCGSNSHDLGGLVGYTDHGCIINCYAIGNITGGIGSFNLGGLVGFNRYSTISNSRAEGLVVGGDSSRNLGGLVGHNFIGNISNCYATGTISGYSSLGGLVGYNHQGSISNSYADGQVAADLGNGGLVGYSYKGSISKCYFLNTSGPDNGYGFPLTDTEMQIQSSFVGWDFVDETTNGTDDLWRMGFMPPGYPILYFQRDIPGDRAYPYGVDLIDIAALGDWWGCNDCDSRMNCKGLDLDLSGDIALPDLMIMLSHWLDGK